MKGTRHGVILDVIDRERVSNQEMLRQRLMARGFEVTQATLSRDLKELGVVKRPSDGAYHRPPPPGPPLGESLRALRRMTAEFLKGLDRSEQLVVLRTEPGHAALLALSMDRAALAEVLGTVAGDDTILVICRDGSAGQALAARLAEWRSDTSGQPTALVQ